MTEAYVFVLLLDAEFVSAAISCKLLTGQWFFTRRSK